MVRIINAFRGESPIGNVLTQLGQQLFGDQAGASINREQAYALQRSNVETDNLAARTAATGGAQMGAADPINQAMMIAAGYDPSDYANMALMGAANQFGFDDPRTTNAQLGAGIGAGSTATGFNRTLAENARQANQTDATQRYNVDTDATTTIATNDARIAEDARQFGLTPYSFRGPDGMPIIGTNTTAIGERPILSNTDVQGTLAQNAIEGAGIGALPAADQRYIGADANEAALTPRNYLTPTGEKGTAVILDGVLIDVATREPLPQGTQTFTSGVQATTVDGLSASAIGQTDRMQLELGLMNLMGTDLIDLVAGMDPRQFGAAGSLMEMGRGLITTASNIAGLLGSEFNAGTVREAVGGRMAAPQPPGMEITVTPDVFDLMFDPSGSELQTMAGLFIYQAASAIANQEGRGLSNEDVQRITKSIGSPYSWGMDQATYANKLRTALNIAQRRIDYVRRVRGLEPVDWAAGGDPATPGGTGAPATTTEGGLPAGWTLRPDGVIVTDTGVTIEVLP
jgi:hypothetical protein